MATEYSPYYPYEKVQTGYLTMQGTEEIPYQIIQYLLACVRRCRWPRKS